MGDPDTDNIVGSLVDHSHYHRRKDAVIISTSTGEQIPGRSLGTVLQRVVSDILQEPLRWSTVTQSIASRLQNHHAVLISAGPVRAADSLRRELTREGVKIADSLVMQPLQTLQNPINSGDIAIVGVSGRLPGGETLEEIWTSLEEGQDLHKKVRIRCRKRSAYRSYSIDSQGSFRCGHALRPVRENQEHDNNTVWLFLRPSRLF